MARRGFGNFLEKLTRIPRAGFLLLAVVLLHSQAAAFTLSLVDGDGNQVSGFRYLVEEDNTSQPTLPGNGVAAQLDGVSLDIHKGYAPLAAAGRSDGAVVTVDVPTDKRYFVSVLPFTGHGNSGAPVAVGQGAVTAVVNALPIPTAQISVLAFVDHSPVNNVFDLGEIGLGGCSIQMSDAAGPLSADAFGNPLGTQYQFTLIGGVMVPVRDVDGNPVVTVLGNGTLSTLTLDDYCAAKGLLPDPATNACSAATQAAQPARNPYGIKVGEALIKYLAPGKYGLVVVPPRTDANGVTMIWSQTATIEGTPTVDAWVKANEPRLFVEGFGTGFNHAFFGFVKTAPTEPSPFRGQTISALGWQATVAGVPVVNRTLATGSVSGTLRLNHFSRPPNLQGYFAGAPIPDAWVGLNDPATGQGLYAAPCDPLTGYFEISNVPPGTYRLVNWDTALDYLFGIQTVTVPAGTGTGGALALGDLLVFRWFGNLEGAIYLDANRNGIRDAGEIGIPDQAVNLRFRDGSIYQSTVSTPPDGEYALSEVFPFFKWLVTEVDFARFKATGVTNVVDDGGDPVGVDLGFGLLGVGKLAPQPQRLADGAPTEGADYRTVTGEVLTQAMHLFLGQTNMIDWGKDQYQTGENGGISGIVYYAVTRAENDPRLAAGETWEPGIPRVVLNLYRDLNANGVVDDLNGDGLPTLADADNFPFQWAPVHQFLDDASPNPDWTGVKGAEDVDRDSDGVWNPGDAINTATSDSFDDSRPTGCIQTLPTIRGEQIAECADSFGTWNQIRDGVFDGGYAFAGYYPGGMISGSAPVDGLPTGTYIVEMVTPPHYELLKEEDKNVDFGLSFDPSPQVLSPLCFGAPHTVPPYLSFNTQEDGTTPLLGVDPAELVPGFFAGQTRPLCNMKQIAAAEAKNAAIDFFLFTQVPKAARAVGFANNDLGAEFNQASPNFGEKLAPSWIPVSFHDWTGREITRVYTDEFGGYNALIHSTFTVNVPSPTGVSPQILTLILNNPIQPGGAKDPYYNPIYSVTPWTLDYMPAKTSYLDTPLVPLAAFAVNETKIDTDSPDGTPVIGSVKGSEPETGAVICTDRTNGRTITINSAGQVQLVNPAYDPAVAGSQFLITRDYSFGDVVGSVLFGDTPLTLVSWTPAKIVATVPTSVAVGVYRLGVTRGDNGRTTLVGESFFIATCGTGTVQLVTQDLTPGSNPIQDAIDLASAGDLLLVGPGAFNANVVMNKPVRLQGAGIGKTFINANPATNELLAAWHAKIDGLGGAAVSTLLGINLFSENEAPGIVVFGQTDFTNPVTAATATLNPGNLFATPGQARIDGFTISGSKAGGGIHVLSGVGALVISNNEITGNQGTFAGGISAGIRGFGAPSIANADLVIRGNHIHKNGGTQGAGGIGLFNHTNNYLVEGNRVEGNFSRYNGGGIAHVGLCEGVNVIRDNEVLFNEDFFGAVLNGAGDGGGIFVGSLVAIDPATGLPVAAEGSGNVTIEGNLIQGNLSGSGHGGGIRAAGVNGQDVAGNPANALPVVPGDPPQWSELRIYDNIIVNNVAAFAGGGISLQDVLRATIVNNTIAHNDTTATSLQAFAAGAPNSTPQPAGIASGAHTALLLGLIDAGVLAGGEPAFSDPTLANNIILENRSYFTTNGGNGGLSINTTSPYWDLGVSGTATPEFLDPRNSVLTSLTDTQVPTHIYNGSNVAATSGTAFIRPYFNAVESAIVVDEGGNNINIRFTPIVELAGDYHLRTGSPAIDAGDNAYLATVGPDIDNKPGEPRPNGVTIDIGADEFYTGVATKIGVWRAGSWYLDANGNGDWDFIGDILSTKLNLTVEVPVAGDWDGVGRTETGFFVQGAWYLDSNGDGVWSGPGVDTVFASFGVATDVPVTGDWDGDGTTEIGVFRNGSWYLDYNGNGGWDGTATAADDRIYTFGVSTDKPVTGDWDGVGTTEIGVFRNGSWYVDYNGNGDWDGTATVAADRIYTFGVATDRPVTGDWDGDNTTDIGVFRNGSWYLDYNGNGGWDGTATAADRIYAVGVSTDTPLSGDWDGDGAFQVAVYRSSTRVWYLDNGDGGWDLVAGIDVVLTTFSAPTDSPVTGDWDGDGIAALGTYRQGQWFLGTADGYLRGYASWNGPLIDSADASFGTATDIPVAGDWNGDGKTQLGVYRQGQWFLDANGNRKWDADLDTIYANFGVATDLPVSGDMNGDGVSEVGVYRPGTGMWYFDLDGSGSWSGCQGSGGTDLCLGPFGVATDIPVTGDWDGNGTDEIGSFRQGSWYLDNNGNGIWDGVGIGSDLLFSFGVGSDTPVTGIWP